MLIGNLDRRVTIQQRTDVQDTYGAPVPTWSDLAEVWAQVTPVRGVERMTAEQLTSDATTRIRIRYRAGITELLRVSYEGKVYQIHAVLEVGRREGLDLLTSLLQEG